MADGYLTTIRVSWWYFCNTGATLNPCWIWAMFLYWLNGKWMNMEAFDPAPKLAQGLNGIICWLTTTTISTILRRCLKFDTPFHPLLTHGETMLNHHFPVWNGLKLWVYQPCSDQPKSFRCISNYDPIFVPIQVPFFPPLRVWCKRTYIQLVALPHQWSSL